MMEATRVDLAAPRHHDDATVRAAYIDYAMPAVGPRDLAVTDPTSVDVDVDVDVEPRVRSELAARTLNIVLASVALVLLAPLLLAVAVAIKLTSPGPILYRQVRVGLDRRRQRSMSLYDRRAVDLGGNPFPIYKFRSMYVGAEAHARPVWAERNDRRVTPVGAFLRRSRLDELPQLLNVLAGDMNIVGPRPERPGIFVRLRRDVDRYPLRQRAMPGITGWAQVNLGYDSSVDDVRRKVDYDLVYLQRQGLVEDCRILLRTIPVVLFGRGAQ